MKRQRVFYPPLAAAFPVLAVFSANLSLCPLNDLWRPLGIVVIGAVALWLICGAVWRDVARGAASATAIVAACYLFRPVDRFAVDNSFPSLPLWIAPTLVVAAIAGWKWKWHQLLNVVGAFLVLSSAGTIALGYARISHDEANVAHSSSGRRVAPDARPDIYYIILDGYGRADQLQRVMRYDNSPFISALQERGFYVAEHSHSNYVQTELSLASSLNGDLLQTLIPKQAPSSDDRSVLDKLASDNEVARYLKSIGYEYIAITSGFPSLTFDNADLHLGAGHRVSLLESALLDMTPFSLDEGEAASQYEERRVMLRASFDNLHTIANQSSVKPRFVFVHVLAPHPPFVFTADGNPTPKPRGAFGYWDGSDFFAMGHSANDYREGYVNQLEYVNRLTLSAVDDLLSRPGTKPIVLLQGDHGSKLGLDQNSLQKTDIVECMSNLMAFEVPEPVKSKLYPTMTPVNSFRILLSSMFGADLPNREDRSWFSNFESPYRFQEVTSRLH